LTKVESWVVELTEEVMGGSPFEIGDTVRHPDGRMVQIMNGQYWGTHGVSNFWYWREVRHDGSLGPEECGYGWKPQGTSH
jgi:hypothetical protein